MFSFSVPHIISFQVVAEPPLQNLHHLPILASPFFKATVPSTKPSVPSCEPESGAVFFRPSRPVDLIRCQHLTDPKCRGKRSVSVADALLLKGTNTSEFRPKTKGNTVRYDMLRPSCGDFFKALNSDASFSCRLC